MVANTGQHARSISERVKELQRQLERVGVRRPGYHISDQSKGRAAKGDRTEDAHTVHTARTSRFR